MSENPYLNPQPRHDWELSDWIDAAGVDEKRRYAQIADEVVTIQALPETRDWEPTRINQWVRRTNSIPSRDDAIAMIKVLRHIAEQNDIHLFDNDHIVEHGKIFLQSGACKNGPYQELRQFELWEICRDILNDRELQSLIEDELRDLRGRVQPQPPERLFGRTQDTQRLLQSIDDNLVSVIDAPGGEGKTALAWESAIFAWQQRRFLNFDWTTDKRRIITMLGRKQDLNWEGELGFEKILKSMVYRFRWSHLFGVEGQALERGCAIELRKSPYLIIVDNLETIPRAGDILERLQELLKPWPPHTYQWSRALVTSRVWINNNEDRVSNHINRVHITGIEEDARIPFLLFLQERWQPTVLLTAQQLDKLSQETHGNPLLMQIAIRRYVVVPNAAGFEAIIAHLQGEDDIFVDLFGDLIEQISPTNLELARAAAREVQQTANGVIDTQVLQVIWGMIQGYENWIDENEFSALKVEFMTAVDELINNCILSPIKPTGYNMHPLIQKYLLTH